MDERFYSTDDSAIVEKYGGKVKAIMELLQQHKNNNSRRSGYSGDAA